MKSKLILVLVSVCFVLIGCVNNSKENDSALPQEEDQKSELSDVIEAKSKLASDRYSDPNSFFKIVPPDSWKIEVYPQDPRGKVAFIGPEGIDLRILAKGLDHDSFEDMYNELKETERNINTNMNMERIVFFEIPAIKRQFTYNGLKILFIDFMLGNTTHNLMYSAPPRKFENYESLVWESINTYEPILREIPAAEVKEHYVARSVRLATLFFESGNYKLAKVYINEGLNEDPKNIELLDLQRTIATKSN